MCKNLDGENLANFGKSSISPNFSGAKVSLYMVIAFITDYTHTVVTAFVNVRAILRVCMYLVVEVI